MKSNKLLIGMLLGSVSVGALLLPACSTAPVSDQEKANLSDESNAAFADMKRSDPTLDAMLNHAYGYVVFPSIGKGGAGVGGAYGRGEVFEQGRFIGYADMTQGTIGAQLGAETYSELIVFENKAALNSFKANKMQFAAGASAVALKSGAATNVDYVNGVAVFTHMSGGLMAEAVVGGQQFTYEDAD